MDKEQKKEIELQFKKTFKLQLEEQEATKKNIDKLESEFNEKKSFLESVNKEIGIASEELIKAKEELDKLNIKTIGLENKCSAYKTTLKNDKSEVDKYWKEFEAFKKSEEDSLKERVKEIGKIELKIKDIAEEVKQKLASLKKDEDEMEVKKSTLVKLEVDIKNEALHVSTLKNEFEKNKIEAYNLMDEYRQKESKLKSREKEVEEFAKSVEAHAQEVNNREKSLNDKEIELDVKLNDIVKLSEKVDNLIEIHKLDKKYGKLIGK